MARPKKISWRMMLTAEPVIFFYAYGLFMHLPVIQQYVYSRVSKARGFPYDFSKKTGCGNETTFNATLKQIELEVQSVSSYVHLGIVMFASLPSIFMSLLIGSWTDSRGRKPALLLPAIGSTVEAVITILVMYFEWPIYVLFVGSAINGCCGYFTTMVMGVMSYIADSTDESQRPLRLAIMELLVFIGGMISQLTSGLWIERYGFIAPYWFILVCLTLSCIFTVVLLPESRPREDIQEKTPFCSCRSLTRVWKVYTTRREGGRRNLFFLTFCSSLMTLIVQGIAGVIVLFLLHTPLCFSPEFVGYFSAFRFLCIGVGAITGIKVLGLWMTELKISWVGMMTNIGALVLFGFSTKIYMVFLVPLVGLFTGCVIPIFRGMMSRIVGKDEQGALFSAVASLETLCNFAGAFIFNSLYPASLKFDFPGFVFFLGAIISCVPFILTCFLKQPKSIMSKRDIVQVGGYETMDDEQLENPVTVLSESSSSEATQISAEIRSRGTSTSNNNYETTKPSVA